MCDKLKTEKDEGLKIYIIKINDMDGCCESKQIVIEQSETNVDNYDSIINILDLLNKNIRELNKMYIKSVLNDSDRRHVLNKYAFSAYLQNLSSMFSNAISKITFCPEVLLKKYEVELSRKAKNELRKTRQREFFTIKKLIIANISTIEYEKEYGFPIKYKLIDHRGTLKEFYTNEYEMKFHFEYEDKNYFIICIFPVNQIENKCFIQRPYTHICSLYSTYNALVYEHDMFWNCSSHKRDCICVTCIQNSYLKSYESLDDWVELKNMDDLCKIDKKGDEETETTEIKTMGEMEEMEEMEGMNEMDKMGEMITGDDEDLYEYNKLTNTIFVNIDESKYYEKLMHDAIKKNNFTMSEITIIYATIRFNNIISVTNKMISEILNEQDPNKFLEKNDEVFKFWKTNTHMIFTHIKSVRDEIRDYIANEHYDLLPKMEQDIKDNIIKNYDKIEYDKDIIINVDETKIVYKIIKLEYKNYSLDETLKIYRYKKKTNDIFCFIHNDDKIIVQYREYNIVSVVNFSTKYTDDNENEIMKYIANGSNKKPETGSKRKCKYSSQTMTDIDSYKSINKIRCYYTDDKTHIIDTIDKFLKKELLSRYVIYKIYLHPNKIIKFVSSNRKLKNKKLPFELRNKYYFKIQNKKLQIVQNIYYSIDYVIKCYQLIKNTEKLIE